MVDHCPHLMLLHSHRRLARNTHDGTHKLTHPQTYKSPQVWFPEDVELPTNNVVVQLSRGDLVRIQCLSESDLWCFSDSKCAVFYFAVLVCACLGGVDVPWLSSSVSGEVSSGICCSSGLLSHLCIHAWKSTSVCAAVCSGGHHR